MIDRWLTRAREPIDPASLIFWRFAFAGLMLVAVIRFFVHGWITEFYVEPDYLFAYPGLSFVRPWPGVGMYVHFIALGALAIMWATGIAFRLVAAIFCVAFTYVELLDQTHYLNHYYLVSLLAGLSALMPIGRGVTQAPRWCLWVLRAQVGLVYFYAGVAKLGSDWLLDAQPLTIWLASNSDFPLIGPLLPEPSVAYIASWAAAVFDLTLVGWLLIRRTRALAFAAAVVFHLLTIGLFNLGLFPWLMIANATLFFEPGWPRQVWRRLTGRSAQVVRQESSADDAPRTPRAGRGRLARIGFGVYFSIQALLPMRHLAYPGDVHWTEEGMRFSWKVMVAEKAGMARFTVEDRATGRRFLVYPRTYLTRRQEKMMSVQPEMIRHFAHYLAGEFAERGVPDVAVYAEVYVALNGRRSQPLIDPEVDLASESFSLAPYSWIVRGRK